MNNDSESRFIKDLENRVPNCLVRALSQPDVYICDKSQEDCLNCPWSQFHPRIVTSSIRIKHLNRNFGVLTVSYPNTFDDEQEIELLKEIAGDISFSLYSMEIERARIERVKELTCLYDINRLALEHPEDVDSFIKKIIPSIKRAYRLTEITEIRIRVYDNIYTSRGFTESAWSQKAEIQNEATEIGLVEAFYTEEAKDEFEGPFLREERELIDGIAQRISQYIIQLETSRALQEEEMKYRRIIENSRDAAYVVVGTQIVYANMEAANLLHVDKPVELIGKDILDYTHPDSRNLIQQRARERQSGIETPERYTAKILTLDGVTKTAEFLVSQVEWEGEIASLAFTRDITERVRSTERLSALHSHANELELVETQREAIEISLRIIKDVIGCEYSTFAIREGDVLKPIHALGRELLDVVIPIDGTGLSARAARENATVYAKDVRVSPDYIKSSMDSLSELVVPVSTGNEVEAVIILEGMQVDSFSESDISLMEVLSQHIATTFQRIRATEERISLQNMVVEERIKTQQAEEMDRLKSNFISTATHEIRTPLTVIIGFLDLLTSENSVDIPDEVKSDLEIVHRNASRLVKLTNDLLDTQRITSGRLEVEFETFDLIELLGEVVEEVKSITEARNQTIEVEAPDTIQVSADRVRISQVLINFLSNANKFTPDNGLISIVIGSQDGQANVDVSDTGIGLGEDDIGKLFTPFPGIRHNQDVSSTGLGLAICKGIIDLHGGDIFASSDGLGAGSMFSFSIPISR